jgi:hypothetical protein
MPIGNNITGSGGGGSGSQTAASTSTTQIEGISGSNVQAALQSLADGFVISRVATQSISPGDAVYLTAAGTVSLANVSSQAASTVLGIALNSASASTICVVQIAGNVISLPLIADITKPFYLGATPGSLVQIAPSVVGQHICYLGVPVSTSILTLSPLGDRYIGVN